MPASVFFHLTNIAMPSGPTLELYLPGPVESVNIRVIVIITDACWEITAHPSFDMNPSLDPLNNYYFITNRTPILRKAETCRQVDNLLVNHGTS